MGVETASAAIAVSVDGQDSGHDVSDVVPTRATKRDATNIAARPPNSAASQWDYCDSSDEEDLRNTIGNVPIGWYDGYAHVGYDWSGKRILKPAQKSEIERFLDKLEDPNYWRTVTDRQTGGDVVLSDHDVQVIRNISHGRFPVPGYNPYQPYIDYYSGKVSTLPPCEFFSSKAGFTPSKDEEILVEKLAKAIRSGRIKPRAEKKQEKKQEFYDLWSCETQQLTRLQQARLKMAIPMPKMRLPGHEESYNPPAEYVFTEEEEEKWKKAEPEERPIDFIPHKFGSLREVPAYSDFLTERFERCMDLFSAPRIRKMRLNVDPNDLLPKLPKPSELQPFPSELILVFRGHTKMVRTLTVDPTGQFVASGSDDGTVRIWEVFTGRCLRVIHVKDTVHSIAWCPNVKMTLIVLAIGQDVMIMNPGVGDRLLQSETDAFLESVYSLVKSGSGDSSSTSSWKQCSDSEYKEGLRLRMTHNKDVKQVTWHAKGDYFAAVMPEGGSSAVVVHQLSKLRFQHPFSKSKGLVQKVLFHPLRPYFFVATQRHIRVYNLVKQQMVRKLVANCKWISSVAMHPKGDNVLTGSYDCRINWFDLDLQATPYKTFRFQSAAVRSVVFHNRYPLFASVSDDGTAVICHGRVYNDLMLNALIIPVKVLRGHKVVDNLGILDCVFHPLQPWLITCGADTTVRLYA